MKIFIKEENDHITDLVEVKEFIVGRTDYKEIEVDSFPSDILNRCYQYIDSKIVLDEEKYAEFKANTKEAIIDEFMLELLELGVI